MTNPPVPRRRVQGDEQIKGASSARIVPAAALDRPLRLVLSRRPEPEPAAVEAYLRELIGKYDGDVPMIDELTKADLRTPKGTAAIARAALVQLRYKSDDVIRGDLERELAENDLLTAVRLREASADLSELPWLRLHEVARARAEYGDRRYRREPD